MPQSQESRRATPVSENAVTRVCIVCAAGIVSGKEIMALELAEGLQLHNFHVEVATSFWGNGDFSRRLQALDLPVHKLWLGFISKTFSLPSVRMTGHQLLKWPSLMASYRALLRRSKPNAVIHTNWHHLLLLLPILRPGRDFFWFHEMAPDTPAYRWVFRLLERRLTCFICVSNAVASSLQKLGVAAHTIYVVHNALKDPTAGQQLPPRNNPVLRIGIVGQVGPWKGHEDLIDAFAMLGENKAKVELHIIGRGKESFENHLRSKAAALGLSDRIIWRGFVANCAEIYRDLDICVVPSRYEEPFGLVAIEAGFFSIPVVASRRGGLPEIIEHGKNGFLFEAGRPEELALHLTMLINHVDRRLDAGKEGRSIAVRNFGSGRFVSDFRALLQSKGQARHHGNH
jgi:glycosyltransferase involved in cell wall biosynthesis